MNANDSIGFNSSNQALERSISVITKVTNEITSGLDLFDFHN